MIPKKLGRNKPCWCGSGIKYKKCHLNREQQEPVEHWEVSKEFREKFSVELCSAPKELHGDCSKKIIKAHTLPKSASLKAIAIDGHVYGFNFSLESIRRSKGKPQPELIGVNRASTFNGFCKIHDDRIFAPLEKQRFHSTAEQCFLLAYRSFCRECYTKSAMANLNDLRSSLDKGKSIERQMDLQAQSFLMNIGAMAGLRDNEVHKRKFDDSLMTKDFSACQSIIFELNGPPPVMASGAVNPDFDFNGTQIQDLGDLETTPDLLAINSFFDGENGYIVMSWLTSASRAPTALVRSLLEKSVSDHEKYLVQYIFKNFENCFISPNWWSEISHSDKVILTGLMADTASLKSDPNGDGIASVQIRANFPKIQKIGFVNWESTPTL